ncbi:MATE efflux family protein isoform 2 [Hibiscus syriacus]|uniref:Protein DETOXIFICATION n=1 Tax=Hibiscus syriacus TaxID=106335 RepID=A0A6A3BIT8_HIBSY|nr:MATE efflux family protein isoform 2 [Hibiscus syriacus]
MGIMADTPKKKKKSMEESLIPKLEKEETGYGWLTWPAFFEETKKVGYLAGPMVAVTISQYLLQVISTMMVGHLGELALASSSIAISLSSVSGFCVLVTRNGLCIGNAVRAGFWSSTVRKSGDPYLHCNILFDLSMHPSVAPMAIHGKDTCYIGQDPLISQEAVHIPLCWALVFKFGLENIGGALAISISNWLNTIFLVLYMRYSPTCTKTRVPVTMEIFDGITDFFASLSLPLSCLEWWSFELLILLSGLLPHPELETSVLSVCLNTITTLYSIPYGLAAGAREPPSSAWSVVCRYSSRGFRDRYSIRNPVHDPTSFGYVYSNEKEVVDYVTIMAPYVCVSVILDSIHAVLSGIARGCGWQHIGAYVNLTAFYLVGIPVAATLAFWMRWRGLGLWLGIQSGALTQNILLAIVTSCINWEKQAIEARDRLFHGRSTPEYGDMWGRMDDARQQFNDMWKMNMIPDVVSYNTLIYGVGDLDLAQYLKDTMISKGISPDVFTYTILVNGSYKLGNLFTARDLFNEMLHNCLEPDRFAYTTQIIGELKLGDPARAFSIEEQLVAKELPPDLISYNVFVHCHSKLHDLKEACNLLHKMISIGLIPDHVTYTTIIHAYLESGHLRKAREMFHGMLSKGLSPSVTDKFCPILVHSALLKQLDKDCRLWSRAATCQLAEYADLLDILLLGVLGTMEPFSWSIRDIAAEATEVSPLLNSGLHS